MTDQDKREEIRKQAADFIGVYETELRDGTIRELLEGCELSGAAVYWGSFDESFLNSPVFTLEG